MICGRNTGPAAQDHLTGHEFSVVFAQRARERLVARIGRVRAGRPFPAISKELAYTIASSRCRMQSSQIQQIPGAWFLTGDELPFCLGRESASAPARKRVGFEKADVAYRRIHE